jgi:hypothetical protein
MFENDYLNEVLKKIHSEMNSENEEIIFVDKHFTMTFNRDARVIRCACYGFPRTEAFRAMALTIAETLAKHNSEFPVINCLVDTTELLIVDYKDLEWAAKEGDILFYKLGVRKIAFIVPETRFEKFYLETYKYHATRHPENHIQREQFKTEDEALAWLREPVKEIL